MSEKSTNMLDVFRVNKSLGDRSDLEAEDATGGTPVNGKCVQTESAINIAKFDETDDARLCLGIPSLERMDPDYPCFQSVFQSFNHTQFDFRVAKRRHIFKKCSRLRKAITKLKQAGFIDVASLILATALIIWMSDILFVDLLPIHSNSIY